MPPLKMKRDSTAAVCCCGIDRTRDFVEQRRVGVDEESVVC